jgi:hypothetical protein
LARNCQDTIDKNVELSHRLGEFFKSYKIVILENNSEDSTREKISYYGEIDLIGDDDGEDFSNRFEESRIKRMARYRTNVQNYIKEKYSHYDYTIVIDFDIKLWSIDGVLTSIAWEKDFDVMGSFSQKWVGAMGSEDGWVHYDRWAFKFHSWEEEWSLKSDMDMKWFSYWKPPIGAKPIQCLSVFGGLAIYKMEAFLSGSYGHKHPEEIGGFNTVEHAQFHYTLHKNGYNKIFLNPSQRCLII